MFDCKVTADPAPTITWMKGTQQLKEGGKLKMIQTGDKNNLYSVSLEIDKAGKDDGGEYKCIAKNSLGDSTATITLNFEGRHFPVMLVLNIILVFVNRCQLKYVNMKLKKSISETNFSMFIK